MRLGRGIVENDALLHAQDIMENRFWQQVRGHGIVAQMHDDRIAVGRGFRCDPQRFPRGRSNRPRSAPACSIAVRISVSISFPERSRPTRLATP